MIRRIRHRGLRRLYESGDASGVPPRRIAVLEDILTVLDAARTPADVNLPGLRLHPLRGNRRGEWAVRVSANWRVTFRFDGQDVTDVKYEDYH